MTNTLHRQGSAESLRNDYIIFAHTAKGITVKDLPQSSGNSCEYA